MHRRIADPQDRRSFLKMLATAGGVAAIGAPRRAAAQAGKVVNIRVGNSLAPEHPATQALNLWGDLLAKKTGGAFKVQVHPGGILGTGRTGPEGVAIGTVEAFWADPSEYASFNQALNIVSAPFIWNDRTQLQKAVRDPAIYDRLYEPVITKGFRALALGYTGTRHLTTKNTPAKKPADLKGLRIRVPEIPVYRDMVGAWGATPTPVPMPEVFTALQSGIVQGQENPYPQILSQRFYEVQKYLVQTAHITQTGSIIFNERLYQQQSKDHQRALVESAREAMDWFLEFLTAQEGKMLEQLKGYGMTVVEPDQAAFRDAMKPLYEKYDNIWTKELRERIQNFK